MTDIKKPNYLVIFFKYIYKSIVTEFDELPSKMVSLIKYLWHKFSYPNAWFYAVFVIYALRFFMIKNRDPYEDTLIIIIMVILLLWQEYDRGDFLNEYRKRERERILEKAKEQYPPKKEDKKDGTQ